jgi:predicted DNA-binding transcriptional regulator YafY
MLAAMLDTSTRLLRLLSVLQARRFWTGAGLADRLEITPRTLRRDIDRLRSLGYTIAATAGPGGGYQLAQGTALPPLLLDDEEAVAIAVALRSAADTFAGMGKTAVNALLKLNQLLPARLHKQVGALQAMTVSVVGSGARLTPDTLTTLAAACRDRRRVTLSYRDGKGKPSQRSVEPLRLAHTGNRRWYLLAWDLSRDDWRTLRVDRIGADPVLGEEFVPRPPPADVERYVSEAISYAPYRHRARFKLSGSAAALSDRVPPWVGVLEPLDARHSVLSTGAESPEGLVYQAMLCGVDFEVIEPQELRPLVLRIAARLQRAGR